MKTFFRALVFLSVFAATPALAAVCDPTASNLCIDKECPTLGLTQMQKDGKKLLACLKDAHNDLVWAAMASGLGEEVSSPEGTLCGLVYKVYVDDFTNGPDSTPCTTSKISINIPCDGQSIITGGNANTAVLSTVTCSASTVFYAPHCPSGYTFYGGEPIYTCKKN